jgi:hypothetical protein
MNSTTFAILFLALSYIIIKAEKATSDAQNLFLFIFFVLWTMCFVCAFVGGWRGE